MRVPARRRSRRTAAKPSPTRASTPSPEGARGGLRLLTRDLPGAGEDIGEALRRDPRNAATVHLRGLLRERLGDPAGAAADMRNARAMQPQVEERVAEIFGNGLRR